MAYIKFNVTQITDSKGTPVTAKVNRMESNMVNTETYQPVMIYHALSFATKVRMWMVLDQGILDRDILMGEEVMILDSGVLDCDTLF